VAAARHRHANLPALCARDRQQQAPLTADQRRRALHLPDRVARQRPESRRRAQPRRGADATRDQRGRRGQHGAADEVQHQAGETEEGAAEAPEAKPEQRQQRRRRILIVAVTRVAVAGIAGVNVGVVARAKERRGDQQPAEQQRTDVDSDHAAPPQGRGRIIAANPPGDLLTGNPQPTQTIGGVMPRFQPLTVVLAALVGLAGCGGSLSPPDGSGSIVGAAGAAGGAGGGAAGGGIGPTGIGGIGGLGRGDAGGSPDPCNQQEQPLSPAAGMPCHYALPPSQCDLFDNGSIRVKVDGVQIPHDPSHANGWDYTDSNFDAIDIFGPSCDALTNGTATTVSFGYRILI
jgi:hypothetical protein